MVPIAGLIVLSLCVVLVGKHARLTRKTGIYLVAGLALAQTFFVLIDMLLRQSPI